MDSAPNPNTNSPKRGLWLAIGYSLGLLTIPLALIVFRNVFPSSIPIPPSRVIARELVSMGHPDLPKSYLNVCVWFDSKDWWSPGPVRMRTSDSLDDGGRVWDLGIIGQAASGKDAIAKFGHVQVNKDTDTIEVSGENGVQKRITLREARD